MGRLKPLGARVATIDISAARVPPKTVDPFYQSPEWRASVARIWKREKGRCILCAGPGKVVDHIRDRKDGGTDEDDNLRLLCRTCDNRIKEDHLGRRRTGGQQPTHRG